MIRNTPRVSVIIPTYNRGPRLAAAVESVLGQTYHDLELIVCDDGSTDDTPARMSQAGPTVRYLRLEHTGSPGGVRNRGIRAAQGELIAFLDDDDYWHPEKLARQIAALDAEPAAGLAYSNAEVLLPDGSLTGPVLSPDERSGGGLFSRLLKNCFLHPSTVVVRRIVLDTVGLFDESLDTAEDYDLWLRLSHVTRGVCVPDPLVRIHRAPSGQSGASGLRAYENAIDVLRRQLRSGSLSLSERLACLRAIGRLHRSAGTEALDHRDLSAARRHSLRAITLDPMQRTSWSVLLASLGVRTGRR